MHAIIAMASALKLDQVAEGVETVEQADQLMALGCTSMQGYYFGRPIDSEELVAEWRREHSLVTAGGADSRCVAPRRPRTW